MKSVHPLAVIFLAILLTSCKIKIVVPEGGSVVNASGGFSCASGATCEVDVVDFFFDQIAIAKPGAGYRFKAWKEGKRRFCGGDTKPCRIYTVGLNSNEALAEIMTAFFESDEIFYLQPIFEKAAEDVKTSCGLYPHPSNSPYVLPFKVGASYPLLQGNCGPFSHFEGTLWQFAFDFTMPIGTEVVAMRSGVVGYLVEEYDTNAKFGDFNWVLIVHDDNAQSYYSHLAQNGVLVSVGDSVEQGQVIGISGHSGTNSPIPHLHVGVRDARDRSGIPITFKNVSPPGTAWLLMDRIYKAQPY
jgi:hypothetical protein